jgi:dUTP pyrophosphatase
MELRFKKLREGAILPAYATDGSAALDLYVPFDTPDREEGFTLYSGMLKIGLGIAVEVPPGHALLLFSRSGHAAKHQVRLANCVGVIDQDYRGEIVVMLYREAESFDETWLKVREGDRIAQAILLPIPRLEPVWAEELTQTARGEGGFGSTGR